jgi:hypothetical protein
VSFWTSGSAESSLFSPSPTLETTVLETGKKALMHFFVGVEVLLVLIVVLIVYGAWKVAGAGRSRWGAGNTTALPEQESTVLLLAATDLACDITVGHEREGEADRKKWRVLW